MAGQEDERTAIITVHGTGDSAPGPDGHKWWQRGSEFAGWLTEELEARGVLADIHPLIWSGANSSTDREEAAIALDKQVRNLGRDYASVHVVGHSHGGNVANDAAVMLNWRGGRVEGKSARDRLRSITTVGTPFFQSGVNSTERLGSMLFGLMMMLVLVISPIFLVTLFATIVVDPLIALVSSGFDFSGPWYEAKGPVANRGFEAPFYGPRDQVFALISCVISVVALIFMSPVAWRGVMRMRRAGRARPHVGIFSILHPLDEAISLLQRVDSLHVEPFERGSLWRSSRTSGIVWGVWASAALPIIGLSGLAVDWGLANFLNQSPEFYQPIRWVAFSEYTDFGNAAYAIFLGGLICAPLVFTAAYLLCRALALVGLEWFSRGHLNRAVGGALKGIALGKDGDHNPGNVSSRSHAFGTMPLILDGALAERMVNATEEASGQLFKKYRTGAFKVDADQGAFERGITEDTLTWDALIHTTYFDHREIAEAVAGHVTERLPGSAEGADALIAPKKLYEDEPMIARLVRVIRGWVAGLVGLAVGLVALLGGVAFLALRVAPISNNDHLAEQRGLIPPPAPFVIGQVIEKGEHCDVCPEMVVLPGGAFVMGSPSDERGRLPNEGPMRRRTVEPFAVAKFEVTLGEWAECNWRVCSSIPLRDVQLPEDADRPVTGVSYRRALAYIGWLNDQVEGSPYRLLREHEWEYASRAGTTTPYWWGEDPSAEYANFYSSFIGNTVPVGSYPANPFGLHDMNGNVGEWVEESCYSYTLPPAPVVLDEDFAADECRELVVRGGSWSTTDVRTAVRERRWPDLEINDVGFRVARTLEAKER